MFFSRSHQLTPPWFVQPLVIAEKKQHPHNLNCLLLVHKAIILEVSQNFSPLSHLDGGRAFYARMPYLATLAVLVQISNLFPNNSLLISM